MNRENLKKLADGLRGPLVAGFDMTTYIDTGDTEWFDDDEIESVEAFCSARPGCGTAACAAGHATYLVAPKLADEYFSDYCRRIFGVNPSEPDGPWDWCFGASWAYIDNTPTGAADRIEWLLANGVPEDCRDQRRGKAPLCYRSAP